jgi:hypothetical protein
MGVVERTTTIMEHELAKPKGAALHIVRGKHVNAKR